MIHHRLRICFPQNRLGTEKDQLTPFRLYPGILSMVFARLWIPGPTQAIDTPGGRRHAQARHSVLPTNWEDIAQLGARQTEDLKVPCSIHGVLSLPDEGVSSLKIFLCRRATSIHCGQVSIFWPPSLIHCMIHYCVPRDVFIHQSFAYFLAHVFIIDPQLESSQVC
jgi:hypothetical protein